MTSIVDKKKQKYGLSLDFEPHIQIPIWEVHLNFKFVNWFDASIWQIKLGHQDDELIWDVKMIHWLGMPRWQVSLRCQDQHVVGMLKWKVDLDFTRIWNTSFLYLTSYFGPWFWNFNFPSWSRMSFSYLNSTNLFWNFNLTINFGTLVWGC